MRLARIKHYRCGEPAGKWGLSTYVWVPADMDSDELQGFVSAARDAYLDAERAAKETPGCKPPGYGPTIYPNTPDTTTVAELRAEYEKNAQAYKEYNERVDKARKPFAWHLQQVSGFRILQFHENIPDMEVECHWGHNHGTTIDYGATEITDYPPTENDEDEL